MEKIIKKLYPKLKKLLKKNLKSLIFFACGEHPKHST